jgi:hypothetical protein
VRIFESYGHSPVSRMPFLGDPANRFNNVASFLVDNPRMTKAIKLAAKVCHVKAFFEEEPNSIEFRF